MPWILRRACLSGAGHVQPGAEYTYASAAEHAVWASGSFLSIFRSEDDSDYYIRYSVIISPPRPALWVDFATPVKVK